MLCQNISGWVANSVGPDEIPHSVASHLGLHCLLRPVCPNAYGKFHICTLTTLLFNSCYITLIKMQGPVVQSVVSLTSSLRVISLTVLVDSIYNILIFFAEKMWVTFALQKLLTFFQQKISAYLHITQFNFNDIVSFEQLGPECLTKKC